MSDTNASPSNAQSATASFSVPVLDPVVYWNQVYLQGWAEGMRDLIHALRTDASPRPSV